MAFKRGELRLARLNPKKGNEVGKLRPVLIYQTDFLNYIDHPTTTILPLSTHLIDNAYPLRYRLLNRDKIEKDSDILIDQIRAIDNSRIFNDILTILSDSELKEIDSMVVKTLGIGF